MTQTDKQTPEMVVVECEPWENTEPDEQEHLQVRPSPAVRQHREALLLEGRQSNVMGSRLSIPARSYILIQPVESREGSRKSVGIPINSMIGALKPQSAPPLQRPQVARTTMTLMPVSTMPQLSTASSPPIVRTKVNLMPEIVKRELSSSSSSSVMTLKASTIKTSRSKSSPSSTSTSIIKIIETPSKFHKTVSTEVVSSTPSTDGQFSNFTQKSHLDDSQQEVTCQTFTCDVCSAVFSTKHGITNHVFYHHKGVPPPTHICKMCGDVFSCLVNLQGHELNCPNRHNCGPAKECFCKSSRSSNRCDLCKKKFLQTFGLERKLRGPSNTQSTLPISPQNVHKSINSNEKPNNAEVSSTSNKISVQQIQSETKVYKSQNGEKVFYFTNKVTYEPFDKSYVLPKCKFCGKLCVSRSRLVEHERTHTGQKPYKCDVCGKSFSYKASIIMHSRIHTGEKPYQCNICGKSFGYSSTLKVHEYSHTRNRSYLCIICGKKFVFISDLKAHKCGKSDNSGNSKSR